MNDGCPVSPGGSQISPQANTREIKPTQITDREKEREQENCQEVYVL